MSQFSKQRHSFVQKYECLFLLGFLILFILSLTSFMLFRIFTGLQIKNLICPNSTKDIPVSALRFVEMSAALHSAELVRHRQYSTFNGNLHQLAKFYGNDVVTSHKFRAMFCGTPTGHI
jgi:hypothetical protein